jgi:hypothetical protein
MIKKAFLLYHNCGHQTPQNTLCCSSLFPPLAKASAGFSLTAPAEAI